MLYGFHNLVQNVHEDQLYDVEVNAQNSSQINSCHWHEYKLNLQLKTRYLDPDFLPVSTALWVREPPSPRWLLQGTRSKAVKSKVLGFWCLGLTTRRDSFKGLHKGSPCFSWPVNQTILNKQKFIIRVCEVYKILY